jgi:hypothetical protein
MSPSRLGVSFFSSHRPWNEETLDAACRLVLDEVSLPGSAPGGKVEFKRTLIISFLFKFYLKVSQILKRMVNGTFQVLRAIVTPKVEAHAPAE